MKRTLVMRDGNLFYLTPFVNGNKIVHELLIKNDQTIRELARSTLSHRANIYDAISWLLHMKIVEKKTEYIKTRRGLTPRLRERIFYRLNPKKLKEIKL